LALEAVGELESSRAEFQLPGSRQANGFRKLLALLAYT
jgi:hypothetical protein